MDYCVHCTPCIQVDEIQLQSHMNPKLTKSAYIREQEQEPLLSGCSEIYSELIYFLMVVLVLKDGKILHRNVYVSTNALPYPGVIALNERWKK